MSAARARGTQRDPSEAEAMSRVVHRLRQQFPELPAERIEQAVHGRYEQFDGRPIRDFLPILVERSARNDLTATGPQS
jgi:hypothetical protein